MIKQTNYILPQGGTLVNGKKLHIKSIKHRFDIEAKAVPTELCIELKQVDAVLPASKLNIVGPNRRLHFSDVHFFKQQKAKP